VWTSRIVCGSLAGPCARTATTARHDGAPAAPACDCRRHHSSRRSLTIATRSRKYRRMLDLLIKNARIVDGTGASSFMGDLGVADGLIRSVGARNGQTAERVLDADELVLAPGFVDPHTHYDAQIAWDPLLTCSPWHGVTTVIMGNCGVGVAPVKPATREILMQDLVNVEAIPYDVMKAGIEPDRAVRRRGARRLHLRRGLRHCATGSLGAPARRAESGEGRPQAHASSGGRVRDSQSRSAGGGEGRRSRAVRPGHGDGEDAEVRLRPAVQRPAPGVGVRGNQGHVRVGHPALRRGQAHGCHAGQNLEELRGTADPAPRRARRGVTTSPQREERGCRRRCP
jgi:hypothetical protein